jgi:hypothetical protein
MRDDGLPAASAILALELSTEWVMQSACHTAATDSLGGGGLLGHARSFCHAGGGAACSPRIDRCVAI